MAWMLFGSQKSQARHKKQKVFHHAAQREELALPCEVVYKQIPVCSGHTPGGKPIMVLQDWPLILPHKLVKALVDNGYMRFICSLEALEGYWERMLKDFPDHPAGVSPSTSFPMSLYGR